MTETHSPELHAHPDAHADSGVSAYLVVFCALAVFTLISFVVNSAVRESGYVHQHIFVIASESTGFIIILAVAVFKAVLVATFFMHLKFDWGRLYFLIIPALVLGTLLVIVLLPDMVIAWHHLHTPPGP